MKKKEIIVVILAFVLALAFASFIMRGYKASIAPQESVINNDNQVEIEVEELNLKDSQQEELLIKEEKNTKPPQVSSTKKTVIADKIEVKEDIAEEKIESVVQQEKESNVVVITREFKSDSPAKYSFKGYGVLDKASN